MKEKNLYLIDAMALIYRSYYALNKNPRINSKGLNTSAILGFANALLDIIKKHKPSHLGIAFDLQGPTVRHEQFEAYKANRQACPEDIIAAIPIVKELAKAMNIPMLAVEGYEADDVIGTLSKKAAREGFTVYMVTPDKDYAQLVEEKIFMLKLPRMGNGEEILGVKEVIEKFEVKRPKQVIDILGLWGDSSDNIPGVPKIGEKKAKMLMKQFDSIEDIIENSDKIESPSIRKAIEENKDKAILSKMLATIILDVPIEFNEEGLLFELPNFQHCKTLFSELEFRTFEKRFFDVYSKMSGYADASEMFSIKKADIKNSQTEANQNQFNLFGDPEADSPQHSFLDISKTIDNTEHTYQIIENTEDLKAVIEEIKQRKILSFSVQTTSNDLFADIIGISLSCEKHKGYFVFLNQNKEEETEIFNMLKEVFEDREIDKVSQNMKSDKHALLNHNIEIRGREFDIVIAHYLIEPEMQHKFDSLASSYLEYETILEEKAFGKVPKSGIIDIKKIDKTQLINYSVEKADISLQLKPILEEKLRENDLENLFQEIEMPLVSVLVSMEREGVRIDTEQLKTFSDELEEEKQRLESEIFELSEEEFNISSPKQLSEILFKKLKIAENTKKSSITKQLSTSEEVLSKLVDKHPIVSKILEYRSLTKLKGTYVDALPLLVNPSTGRIHTSYNQTTTSTGRLSSLAPNLQNIPIRTALGRKIRKAFVPRDQDYLLMACDYSQIELRIIASMSQDEHMIEAFNKRIDIHQATAAKIYKVALEDVSKDMRQAAKSVNFGIIYGISAYGLSQQLSLSVKEAQALIDQYFAEYPKIKSFIDSQIEKAKQTNYVETMLKRRRYLYEINSRNVNLKNFAQRNAVNMPIQGSSADMIKKAMIEINNILNKEGLKTKMILQVHDELVFDLYKPELKKVQLIVEKQMKEALPLENVPIEVDSNTGQNWLEAH
ncbi:MAG TPA: DNA polymerase I [Bacteroidales bacterium]|nr:DNA polymerase I [Bacteroidales bacterium]